MGRDLLYSRIYNDVKDKILAGETPEGFRLPSEQEMTRHYGVSRITVKRAMDMLTAEGYVSKVQGNGTFVKRTSEDLSEFSEKGGPIGVILTAIAPTFGRIFLESAVREAQAQGLSVMIGLSNDSQETEIKVIETLVQRGVRGFILMPAYCENYNVKAVKRALSGYPVVFADHDVDGVSAPYVGSDNEGGIRKAMDHLFALGHEKVACITSRSLTGPLMKGARDYFVSYAASKYRDCVSLVLPEMNRPTPNGPLEIDAIVKKVQSFLVESPEITAIVCTEYPVLKVAERAAQGLRREVPGDLSLVCFDAPEDPLSDNSYTYIRQNEERIGSLAVKTLMDALEGKAEPVKIALDTELCVGRSTAKTR